MDEEILYCELCKLNFATKEELTEHDWSLLHHRKLDKEKGRDILHTCKLCKEDIFGLLAFTKHIHSEKHLTEVTKLKYSESQVTSFDSTPIQETSETINTTMQTPVDTLSLPAAHFLPKAHYFQSLESPLSSTPLLDTVAKNFQLKPGKPYRFTPQHRPYVPPRPNFRPRFQNPYRYVNPNLQSSPNTTGTTNGNSMLPKLVSQATSISAYTNPNTLNGIFLNPVNGPSSKNVPYKNTPSSVNAYQPSIVQPNTSYPPTSKYTKQTSTRSNPSHLKGISNPFAYAAAKNDSMDTVLNNCMATSSAPSMNEAYLTNQINILKIKYPTTTANASNIQKTCLNDQCSSNNNADNLIDSSPLSKKQRLERYMKKNEIRLKCKKRALLRQNVSRRSNCQQKCMQNIVSGKYGSSLSSSYSSHNGENTSTVSNSDSVLKPKPIKQIVFEQPSHKNNTIHDNLNLNVQFVLRKGREIVNKYNKGTNKGIEDADQDTKVNTQILEQLKLSDNRQTSCNSLIDFTPHFKDININSPIGASDILNTNVKKKNISHSENRKMQMLSEKAQILLQKTKPVRVELAALSPTSLSSVKKPKKVSTGPLWQSSIEQVKFQQRHVKYIRKAVKEALRGQKMEKNTNFGTNATANTSRTVLSSSFGGRNSDCSFKSTGSYNSLHTSLSSLSENFGLQAMQTPLSSNISLSCGSNADTNIVHKTNTGKSRFVYHQNDASKSDEKAMDAVKNIVVTSSPEKQKDALNSPSNLFDTGVPFDMEKVVNELLSKSPGFEYLANEHTKRRKKKKLKSNEGRKLKQAVNQNNLGKLETDRLIKKFEQYRKEREQSKENPRSTQRSHSESEATQSTTDGDSFQRLITSYMYDSEMENTQEGNHTKSIHAAVIIEEKPNSMHHCEFKKNNDTYCDAVTNERFCDYHRRVLKAVELFISKRVASGPSKVSDAVSLIESADEDIVKGDMEQECNTLDTSRTFSSKKSLSENSNDSEVDTNISESDKIIELCTSRFPQKKSKSVCLPIEDSNKGYSHSQVDPSVSSLTKKVGKQPRFKYLRNLTCQSDVHKSNLPPTVRKLLDKKHGGYAIVPNVRAHDNSQSESESDNINHERRKGNTVSSQLPNISSSIIDTSSDMDDNISESCLSEPAGGQTQLQTSSLQNSDVSDLSLLHRLQKTMQLGHDNINVGQNIDPLSEPDPNVLEKLFSIQAPVFFKTLLPTVTCESDAVSNMLFNLDTSADSSNSTMGNMQYITTKSLPVNVITSVIPSPARSIIPVSPTTVTSIKYIPVSTVTSTSETSLSNETPVVCTKSLSVSVITKPSETPVQSLSTSVIITPCRTSSELFVGTPLITGIPSKNESNAKYFSSLTDTTVEVGLCVTSSVTIVPGYVSVTVSTACVTPPLKFQNSIQSSYLASSNHSKDAECKDESEEKTISTANDVPMLSLGIKSPLPVISTPLSICELATTSSAMQPFASNGICNGVSSGCEFELSLSDCIRKSELSWEQETLPCTVLSTRLSDDFTIHESAFINCIKNREAKLATKKFSENTGKVKIANADKDYDSTNASTNMTTDCYNIPVISSDVCSPIESPQLDAETISTLFSFKGPIISSLPNKTEQNVAVTIYEKVSSKEPPCSIATSECATIVLKSANVETACSNKMSVSDDVVPNFSWEKSIDLVMNIKETSKSSINSGENMQSVCNDNMPNSVDLERNTEFSQKSDVNGKEEASSNNCSPEFLRENLSHVDLDNPSQSILRESQINRISLLTADGPPFNEELLYTDKTDDSHFHSVKSNLNTAECEKIGHDQCLDDTYLTMEDEVMSLDSDGQSISLNDREPPVRDGDADSPSVITNASSKCGSVGVQSGQFDSSCNESNAEDTTIFKLEKELNKLQTDEDGALDKLTQANKSLEQLKIVMGKLQDEISLHANKMQKISTEKKKLRIKLQEWRNLRESTVNRRKKKIMSKGHSFNGLESRRKVCNSTKEATDISSDDNLPLSYVKGKLLLGNISKAGNARLVKTIYVNDSYLSSSKENSSDTFVSDSNYTESHHGSVYDTAPAGSPENNLLDIEKKDKDVKSNSSHSCCKTNKKSERRNSLRCQGIEINNKGRSLRNKSKRKR